LSTARTLLGVDSSRRAPLPISPPFIASCHRPPQHPPHPHLGVLVLDPHTITRTGHHPVSTRNTQGCCRHSTST
jgi:hypothetical protein